MQLGRARLAALLGAVAIAAVAAAAALTLAREDARPPTLALPSESEILGPDPLAFEGGRTSAYERAAAFGLSHVLFAKSPGGVAAAARRTAAFRPLVEDAVAGSEFDGDLVEAIAFLESAGRPDVIAGRDPEHAAGLTQILAETATNFLGMRVDLAASRRLTRRIEDARRRGDGQAIERLQEERRLIDARFDPAQALAGTVRYLAEARSVFGRDDLAVVSYHMGIGNLEGVLRAYAGRPDGPIETVVDEGDLDYARIYFDSSPTRHREAWKRLASFGDASQTYYWRVLAAGEIMRLFREDPAELDRLAQLHGRGPSAERVLHPPSVTRRFEEPSDLEDALAAGVLQPLWNQPSRLYFRIDPGVGRIAGRTGGDPAAYRALRRQARGLLRYLAAHVHDLSGAESPLTVTSAAHDATSARLFVAPEPDTATHASFHATGYAFDIRRRYESGAQAAAFQWTLERLEALGLIVWTRGPTVIHITVSPHADVRPAPGDRS